MVPKLITFAPMIDSETWRLLLRHYGVPYQEEPHAFLWGSMLALIRTGSPQVPALCGAGWTLVGPDAAIDRWDAEQPSGCSLIPADPAMKAVAHADWTLFNGTLATHTARLAYYHMLPHREILIGPFTQGIPPREVTFTRAFYPLQRAILSVLLQLTARNADEALSGIRMILDATEARLRDGRRFLQGDRLTLGDLALAAAAAPIILPEGHSALIPPLPLMPPAFAAIVTEMRTRPAARFVQGVYREVDSWRKSEPNQTSLRDGGTLPGAR